MDHTADSSRGLLPAPPFSLLFWKAEHRAAGCPDESAAPVGIVTFTLPPLVGCIAPFRVKARADVAVNMITPETPGAPIRPLMSERHAP